MKKELDEKLVKDFPLLYRDRRGDPRNTIMCFGFPGSGWEPLIRELSSKLEPLIQKYIDECGADIRCRWCGDIKEQCGKPKLLKSKWLKEENKEYICHSPNGFEASYPCAVQVKEKYGSLRFYMSSGTKGMYDLCSEYENKSYKICEECGEEGVLRDDLSWILTLCEKHYKERLDLNEK